MKSTASTDHWPEWFNDHPSTSHNTLPPESLPSHQHSSQATVRHHGDSTLNSADPQQSNRNDTIHITAVPHYINPNDDQQQQQQDTAGTTRSGWHWSTWSAANSWITSRNRRSTNLSTHGRSSRPPVPPTSKRAHHWLDRHKRRTFPPSARVLKLEQRRLTHGNGMKKKHRFGGSSNRKQQKQRDQLFQHPLRRRHSLSGILTSFVQQPSTTTSSSSPYSHSSSPASNGGGGGNSGGSNSGGDITGSSGGGNSSSSSGFFRRGRLPFFLSHPSSNSSRKSEKVTPTVRSSMVLHFTDEDADIASMDIPDTFYLDNNDGDDSVAEGDENPHDSGTTDTDKSISSRQRQKQRLQGPSQESGNWFSNWIMHHPRRKQKQSRNHRLRDNQATVLTTNTNGGRIKVHPSPTPPSTTTTTTTTGNNTTSTPPILNSTDTDDEDGHSTKQKYTEKKRTLPLIRYATLSDLSSLSSSNPSHLMKSSATIGSTGGQKQRHHHLLPLYHHQRHDLPVANAPSSYRFSAFWKSQSGKTGKQIIHVDEQGLAGHATLWSSWATCNYEKSGNILAGLFIFGFLLCPCWWLGAVLYLARTSHFNNDLQSVYLWTPRTFGHLNCWMSAVSLLLVGFIGALAIWYHLSVV